MNEKLPAKKIKKPKRVFDKPADEGELWLVSYADMMTLIACFFILMMAFANYDPVGFNIKAEQMTKHFRKEKYKSSEDPLTELQEEMTMHPELSKKTKVSLINSELIISFSGSVLFSASSYELNPEMSPYLDAMIDLIKTKNDQFHIIIEGHSSSSVNQQDQLLGSSYLVAAARANTVLERFLYFGFNPKQIVTISYGPHQNALPTTSASGEVSEENVSLNRRVIIKVLRPREAKQDLKLGLGIYFKNESPSEKINDSAIHSSPSPSP